MTFRAGAGLDPGGDTAENPGRFRLYPQPKPPANMTVVADPPAPAVATNLIVTLKINDQAGIQPKKFRLYYVNANEYRQVMSQPQPLTPTVLSNIRHYVTDIAMASKEQTLTLPAGPYEAGGWFYAQALSVDGTEGASTGFVVIPLFFGTGIPTLEITSPNYTPTSPYTGPDGLRYREIPVSWLTSSTAPITVGTKYLQIYIFNYNNNGLMWEGPMFNSTQKASTVCHGSFVLECDDGTGGFPDPGPHNVTLYFVSVGPNYQRRPDPASAPNVVITGGIT